MENLIQPGIFYFHPKVQIIPPPPVKYTGEDGRIKKLNDEPFKLQLRESLTYEEILKWFYRINPQIIPNEKRDIAGLVSVYNRDIAGTIGYANDERMTKLDLLLFTIEAATDKAKEDLRPLMSTVEISNYVREGLELYQDKKNQAVESDLDHVI